MRVVLLLLSLFLLTSCSEFGAIKELASSLQETIFGADNAEPPNELKPLEKTSIEWHVVWEASIGDGCDGQIVNLVPAVTEETVFAASRKGEVQARSRLHGEKLWSVEMELPLSSGPVASGDMLFLGTSNAELIALSTENGALLWKTPLSSEILALPKVKNNTVVVRTSDGRLTALDSRTGATRWNHERSIPALSVRSLGSPSLAHDLVLDGFGGGKLLGLTIEEGKPAWETTIAIPHGRSEIERLVEMDAEPFVQGDTVYISGYQAGVSAVSIQDGELLWREGGMFTTQGLAGNRRSLFLSDAQSDLWRLDTRSGADLWKQTELHQRRLTVPSLIKDWLIVGDFEGYLHAISVDDGSIVGRTRLGSDPLWATPVVYDETIYVYTSSGTLAAFTLE